MNNATRLMAVALLIFVAVGALFAGHSFITVPTGAGMGMRTSYLAHSPFNDFLIPGIVLFIVNGILNILAAIAVIKKIKNYSFYIIIQGMLLSCWIILQIVMVRDIGLLHILFFCIGIVLISIGSVAHKT